MIEHFISSCKESLSHIEIKSEITKKEFAPIFLDESTTVKLSSLREGALSFISDYKKLIGIDIKTEIDRDYISNKIRNIITYPSRKDAINLGSCVVDQYYTSTTHRNHFIDLPKKSGFLQAYKLYKLNKWKPGYYKLLPIKYKILIFTRHLFKKIKHYYIPKSTSLKNYSNRLKSTKQTQ